MQTSGKVQCRRHGIILSGNDRFMMQRDRSEILYSFPKKHLVYTKKGDKTRCSILHVFSVQGRRL